MTTQKYRPINPKTDIGKVIEVRNSTRGRWRQGNTLTGIITQDGVVLNLRAGGKVWNYARILIEEEASPQEPKADDNLYRNVDFSDIRKTVEVRDFTCQEWSKQTLTALDPKKTEQYYAGGTWWQYARILKEEPKANDELYREVTRADIGKEVEVLQHKSMSWKKGILKDFDETVEFCQYQVDNLWWDKARIRKEEPANPPAPPQEKPLQSHVAARFDCIDPVVLKLLAECLGYGAKKYYPYSYLCIPVEDHINHALNHINEHRRLGQDKTQKPEDEIHLVNALARITFAISCLAQQGSYPDTYSHPERQE